MNLAEYEQAQEDLQVAIHLEPSNKQIREAWDDLKQHKIGYNNKTKRIAEKYIETAPETSKGEEDEAVSLWRRILCCQRRKSKKI